MERLVSSLAYISFFKSGPHSIMRMMSFFTSKMLTDRSCYPVDADSTPPPENTCSGVTEHT